MPRIPAEVIELKQWRHARTRQIVSAYGALPWLGGGREADWNLETPGYTVRWPDGTIGTASPRYLSQAEAAEIANAYNVRTGRVQQD